MTNHKSLGEILQSEVGRDAYSKRGLPAAHLPVMQRGNYVMRVWESGSYPEYEFLRPRAYFYGSEKHRLAFSVVRRQGSLAGETISEVQWADPAEIRLMGALLLSRKPQWGQFFFESIYFNTVPIGVRYNLDLTHPEVRRALFSYARTFSETPGLFFNVSTQKDAFEPEWAERLYEAIPPKTGFCSVVSRACCEAEC